MYRVIVSVLLFSLLAPSFANAQSEVRRSPFHKSVIKGIQAKVADGSMTRGEGVRLRIAMLSPAFRARAEELAVTQMYFSGEGQVPMNADGTINRTAIDWEALTEFIKVLLPLLLDLLLGLGIGADAGGMDGAAVMPDSFNIDSARDRYDELNKVLEGKTSQMPYFGLAV